MTRHFLELDLSPQRLRHIRWIGGGSGAGKSTIACILAEKHGLRLYHCDDMQSAHTARSNAANHPMLHAFISMTMDERWAKHQEAVMSPLLFSLELIRLLSPSNPLFMAWLTGRPGHVKNERRAVWKAETRLDDVDKLSIVQVLQDRRPRASFV